MIAWIINLFLRPEFFGALAVLCLAGYVYFKVTLNPLLAMICEVAGIVFLVLTAYAWADNRGYARAEGVYKPKLEAAESRAATAEGANVTLQADLKTLQGTLAEQKAAVDDLVADQKRAEAATKVALAKAAASAKFFTTEIAKLKALALAVPPPVMTKQEADDDAAAADALLRDTLRQRIEAEGAP